jgi:pimeloyl-ACP methyl ester carboxylesterase
MGTYVQLGAVQTWYDDLGAGDALVLLHPGGADARAWAATAPTLAEHFHVFTPERRGHGRTADAGAITYDLMTEDTIQFIEQIVGGPAHLVGWSAGAVVALLVALAREDLVGRLVMISGVHHRDGWVPEAIDPDAEPPEALRRGYEQLSPDGAEHYPVVHEKLARMNFTEPTLTERELTTVSRRTLVMVADDDEVTLEHATATYRNLVDAELAVVPGTSHGLLLEKPALCNAILLDFLLNEPVTPFAPVRRRPGARRASGE